MICIRRVVWNEVFCNEEASSFKFAPGLRLHDLIFHKRWNWKKSAPANLCLRMKGIAVRGKGFSCFVSTLGEMLRLAIT
jgi:hypothetical protein